MADLVIREVRAPEWMRTEHGCGHSFYVAEPIDGSSFHAAGDTETEARANWRRRHAENHARLIGMQA